MNDVTDLGMVDKFNWEQLEMWELSEEVPHEWPKQEVDPDKHKCEPAYSLELEAKELAKHITLNVKITGLREFKVRQTIGCRILWLAGKILPFELAVDIDWGGKVEVELE